MNLAGLPAQISPAGMSLVTIEPAPIIAPSPIVTLLQIITPAPIKTCWPISTGPFTYDL